MIARTKVIGHIFDLFKDKKITDFGSLKVAIADKEALATKSTSFNIVRASDLNLDSEGRYRGEEFVYSRTIFDCDRIELKCSGSVDLRDCIFMGTLQISHFDESPSKVYIDTCVANSGIDVVGPCDQDKVSLVSVASPKLRVENLQCHSILLASCSFAVTVLNEVVCEEFKVYDSELGFFEFSQSAATKVSMPNGQFQGSRQGIKKQEELDLLQHSFNPLAIRNRMDLAKLARRIRRTNRLETYEFLLAQTDVRKGRTESADIKYLRAVVQSRSLLEKTFIVASGALVKPARLVFLALSTIVGFAFVYFVYGPSFMVQGKLHELEFLEALYFSGITFATIGYGDIAPCGAVRFVAMAEGMLGVIFASGIVVSFVRRYVE